MAVTRGNRGKRKSSCASSTIGSPHPAPAYVSGYSAQQQWMSGDTKRPWTAREINTSLYLPAGHLWPDMAETGTPSRPPWQCAPAPWGMEDHSRRRRSRSQWRP